MYIITIQETSLFPSKLTQSDEGDAAEDVHIIDKDEDKNEIKLDN